MNTTTDLATLGVEAFAKILKIKPRSLHARLVRRPESLPRPIRRGKGEKLLWLEADVKNWLLSRGDEK